MAMTAADIKTGFSLRLLDSCSCFFLRSLAAFDFAHSPATKSSSLP
jgi:hypothetical protein